MPTAHISQYAGSWYPGNPVDLQSLLDRIFVASADRTGPAFLQNPLAFVVPHAGPAYSGTVAASVYRHLRAAAPARIFVLGFLHEGGRPLISIPDAAALETPLGRTPVDRSAVSALASSAPFALIPPGHASDHSIEIQLPFLQAALPGTPIVPLYVGNLSAIHRDAAAQALTCLLRPGDILLASTDLTHYGRSFDYQPFPDDDLTAENLHDLDHGLIAAAGSLDPQLFFDELRKTASTLCGAAPVALLLRTLQLLGGEEIFQQTLDYQSSGDITGDYSHCVGYGALGYFRASAFELDAPQRAALLDAAHATLQRLRESGAEEPVYPSSHPALARHAGVFVSLHHKHDLLGCIGRISDDLPLSELVPRLALSAALHDPRFPPRTPLPDDVDVEISILTPMKRVRDAGALQIGVHGACLECESKRALLLPQVATELNWTSGKFLDALAQKAGLPSRIWLDPSARLSLFRAQVF